MHAYLYEIQNIVAALIAGYAAFLVYRAGGERPWPRIVALLIALAGLGLALTAVGGLSALGTNRRPLWLEVAQYLGYFHTPLMVLGILAVLHVKVVKA